MLAGVKRLFADPDQWIVFPRAEDASGLSVPPGSSQAVRWCMLGAGERCAEAIFDKPLSDYVECAMREFLDDISDGKFEKGMSYDDEYALVCLGYEFLKGDNNG